MPELSKISGDEAIGDEAIKVFKKLGFHQARQKGSHVMMRRDDKGCVIPRHKELALGTLRSAIKQAGISVDEFRGRYKITITFSNLSLRPLMPITVS